MGMMEADVRAWLFPRAGMGAQFLPTPRDDAACHACHAWPCLPTPAHACPRLPTSAHIHIATDGLKGARKETPPNSPERQDILEKP